MQKFHIRGPRSDDIDAVVHCAVLYLMSGTLRDLGRASKAMWLPSELPKPAGAWGFTPMSG